MSKKGFYSTIGAVALLGATAAVGISIVMARRNQAKKDRLVYIKKDLRRRWFHYLYGYYGKKY